MPLHIIWPSKKPYPAYSPDIAPSDYGMFRSIANILKYWIFDNFEDIKIGCEEFFTSKPKEWYRHQIQLLAERWMKVVENNELYFEEYYSIMIKIYNLK